MKKQNDFKHKMFRNDTELRIEKVAKQPGDRINLHLTADRIEQLEALGNKLSVSDPFNSDSVWKLIDVAKANIYNRDRDIAEIKELLRRKGLRVEDLL